MTTDINDNHTLKQKIKQWGLELGFQQVGISDIDLSADEPKMLAWLEKGYHAEMAYMASHGTKRSRPADLLPGTCLLYTSPSPRDGLLSRMPSSA